MLFIFGITYSFNNTVKYLERARNALETEAATVLVESTIFHELTHVGNLLKTHSEHGIYVESGDEFEMCVYGIDVGPAYYSKKVKLPEVKTYKVVDIW